MRGELESSRKENQEKREVVQELETKLQSLEGDRKESASLLTKITVRVCLSWVYWGRLNFLSLLLEFQDRIFIL